MHSKYYACTFGTARAVSSELNHVGGYGLPIKFELAHKNKRFHGAIMWGIILANHSR